MTVETMISVEEARERILSVVPVLPTEMRALREALGQVLAEDIVSAVTIPPLDNTSMDGYAVRAADTASATNERPVQLRIIGEVAAGYLFDGELSAGEAIRIMTGAPIPPGADAVVPFEETDELAGRAFGSFAKGRPQVGILKQAGHGANIRRAGEDVQAGATVLHTGTELHAAQLGVLASIGRQTVRVYRRPVVAILTTGDELAEPGQTLRPGQIYDSNSDALEAQINEAGGVALRLGIARDTIEDLTAKVLSGLTADLLLTSAGVSRGDYDVVKDVLMKEGRVGFWTVRMRPGKPLAFGSFPAPDGRDVPHIGLPGNPVSSMVAFELMVRPAIFKMMQKTGWERQVVEVTVEEAITNSDGRRVYARAVVSRRDGDLVASLSGSQSSGVLTSMALANALVVCPENVAALQPGDRAQALLLAPVL